MKPVNRNHKFDGADFIVGDNPVWDLGWTLLNDIAFNDVFQQNVISMSASRNSIMHTWMNGQEGIL